MRGTDPTAEGNTVGVRDDPTLTSPLFPNSGPNFVTCELAEVSPGVLEYRPTKKALLFIMVFTYLGILAGVVGLMVFLVSGKALALVGLPAGIPFLIIGSRQSAIAKLTRTFDSLRRVATLPSHPGKYRSPYRSISFDQIDHLQIVEKILDGGEDNDYGCCELNLVLKDGTRLLVAQSPDKSAISSDGARLAKVIGCTFQI